MLGLGVALLQFGFELIGRGFAPVPAIAAVLVAAAALFTAFAIHARRTAVPAIDLTLFKDRAFRIGTLVGSICRIGINGSPFLLPLMLQVGFGVSPLTSGLLTFAGSLGGVMVRPVLSRLLRSFGFRPLLIGSALAASAMTAGFALLGPTTADAVIVAYVFVFGLMRALQFLASNALAYADLAPEKLSSATSMGGMLQQLSVSFGVSLAAMFLGAIAGPHHRLTPDQFHEAFLALALLPLLATPGFLALKPADGVAVSGHRSRA